MKPFTLFTIGACLLCLVALGFLADFWFHQEPVEITRNGWIALACVVGFSLAIAGGLVALMIYSHRAGFDDRVGVQKFEGRRKRIKPWW